LYLTKVKYILDNDVDDMDLYFVEEEYDRFGQLVKVCIEQIFLSRVEKILFIL